MKRLTREPWFGPRLLGWGWTPITWQGWLLTAVFVVLVVAVFAVTDGSVLGLAAFVVLLVLFSAVCYLTGGAPGGPTVLRRRQ